MYQILRIAVICMLVALAACQAVSVPKPPERLESPVGGPERVFSRPVTEIVPLLQDARASGPIGRVGNELVFWSYELAGARPAVLTACAVLPDVDCAARAQQVCRSGSSEILFTRREPGEVRYLNCTAIGMVSPGDLTPTCDERDKVQEIDVRLLSCN